MLVWVACSSVPEGGWPRSAVESVAPAMHAYVERRSAAILGALQAADPAVALAPDWTPIGALAVLSHILLEAREAAKAGSESRARAAFRIAAVPTHGRKARLNGRGFDVVAVRSRDCRRVNDRRYLSPIWTLTEAALGSPPPVETSTVQAAVDLSEAAGLSAYLAAGAGLVIGLRAGEIMETLDSYTVSTLPGTIFTDLPPGRVRLAESLLHEAAHTCLNLSLDSAAIHLPEDERWYSPWKGTDRPVHGILHAAFAFSILASFFGRLANSDLLDTAEREYCRMRLEAEPVRISEAEAAIAGALRHLRGTPVQALVEAELANVSAGARGGLATET